MSDDYTITLETEDEPWADDEIEVGLTEPGPLTQLQILAEAPAGIVDIDPTDHSTVPSGISSWLELVIDEVSTFPKELIGELTGEPFSKLVTSSVNVLVGEHPDTSPSEDYQFEPNKETSDPFGFQLNTNDDGSIDLEEWR